MNIEKEKTARGFSRMNFTDRSNNPCSLQESSLATEAAILFGVAGKPPVIMCSDAKRMGLPTESDVGWMEYPLPPEVLIHDRMLLTQDMVRELLPTLQHFAEHGQLPE